MVHFGAFEKKRKLKKLKDELATLHFGGSRADNQWDQQHQDWLDEIKRLKEEIAELEK